MSEHILNQNSRLSDSIERAIVDKALRSNEPVSIVTLSKNAFNFFKQKSRAFFYFMVELTEEVHKVRAETEKYSRTRW